MKPAPYAEGPLDCTICLIGEAPGEDEVRYQRPFMGRAGMLLDQLLSKAGIKRSACRIENVFQFRPPNNDASRYLNLSKRPAVESEEFRNAREELLERLSQCKANVFVPLGNVPLYALTGLTNVTKRRGSILSSASLNGRKVLPTIHPSAALREYLFQHFIVHDLKRVLRESWFPEVKLLQRELLTSPNFEQALAFIEDCWHFDRVAFDIEVCGTEVSHLSLATSATNAICIPFVEGASDYFTPEQECILWRKLAELLEADRPVKLGQNVSFDCTFLHAVLGICVHPVEDTMVAQGVTFPDFPKGLDFLVATYCDGEPYYKDDGKKYFRNPFGSEETFRRYSAMDSVVLPQVFAKQTSDLARLNNLETYREQARIIEPLVYIARKGIRMNVAGMEKAARRCARGVARYENLLNAICGFPLNANSPKQVMELFASKRQQIKSTDEKTMKRLSRKGFKEAKVILKIRHLRKMLGTYYTMKLDTDNRLRCSYNPVGTGSGRISSSKTIFETGANLQNQPPEMKKLMLADEGYLAVSMDLSQAENRVVAYIANEVRMIEAFETGVDLHKLTAGLIFGIRPEEVSDLPGSCPIAGGQFSQRFWGKKANHGLNYDLGYKTFALYYEMEERDAKFIVERYHMAYPGIRQWHASIREELRRSGRLTDCLGNTRIFMERWGDDLFKSAYSFIPQSTVARKLNRDGLCYLYYNQQLFHSAELLNQVHDSIVFQVPLSLGPEKIAQIIWAVKANLETPLTFHTRTFSIPADTQVGFNLKEMKELKSSKNKTLEVFTSNLAAAIDSLEAGHGKAVK